MRESDYKGPGLMKTSCIILLFWTSVAIIEAADIDDLAKTTLKGAAHEAEGIAEFVHNVISKTHKATEANTPTASPSTPPVSTTTIIPSSSNIDDLATTTLKGAAHEAEGIAEFVHKVILKKHKAKEANTPTASPSTPPVPTTIIIPSSSSPFTFGSTQVPPSSTPLPTNVVNTTPAPNVSSLLALSTTPGQSTTVSPPTSTRMSPSSELESTPPPTSTKVPSSTAPPSKCLPAGLTPLYNFSSFTFTHANATGRFGPTLAALRDDASYKTQAWTQNTSFLNMAIQGIQVWTVPQCGAYNFTVVGASGASVGAGVGGGVGIMIQVSNVALSKGENIYIVVGQKGSFAAAYPDIGGGGGASFVFSGNGSLLLAAGGGGGATSQSNGMNAVTQIANGSSGNPGGSGGNANAFAQGGTSYALGGQQILPPGSQGGISIGGDGANVSQSPTGAGGGGGGASFGNTMSPYIGGAAVATPGYPSDSSAVGGFGGGGGGGQSVTLYGGGGGGGGYYGGGGGDAELVTGTISMAPSGGGGGGSSFVAAGIDATLSPNTNSRDGIGYVSVSLA
ncbi:hypothetical protein COCOBI_01-0200 [Coccomyxa sp. Obi]|nr:hypothetical protein COCOBI_01-0200 [Coccomyxa sp. Obi]